MVCRSLFHVFLLCYVSLAVVVSGQQQADSVDDPLNETSTKTEVSHPKPNIYFLHYNTEIKHRYAKTVISSKVANPANISQEVHFRVVLPEKAFISRFVMIIKDKEYEAYVKEKEEAKADYDAAVQAGQTAAHVELSVRDANKFQVSVNVEAGGKINFNLTYDELLTRTLGMYTNTVNVNPGQIVKDLKVNVRVDETANITVLSVPEFKTKNEISDGEEKENPLAKVVRNPETPNIAEVTWSPTYVEQKQIAKGGLQGQLVVKYDVDRSEEPSQILVDEGYFVHFFAPSNLPTLRKQVVFVLDISGSMYGEKINQLKNAMLKILGDLNTNDYFSIVLFASDVNVWSPAKSAALTQGYQYNNEAESARQRVLNNTEGEILQALPENVDKAKEFVKKIQSTDATNIMGGLRKGLELIERGQNKFGNSSETTMLPQGTSGNPQPIMFFLTDGEPNVDLTNPEEITMETVNLNDYRTPVYSLAFGEGADLKFLRKLSLANNGFARNIYEGSDAALQLNNFYREISSPLLSNVSFTYLPEEVNKTSVTTNTFPIYFKGSEIIVAGKLISENENNAPETIHADFHADKVPEGVSSENLSRVSLCPASSCVPHPHPHPHPIPPKPVNRTVGHLEKMWAYLTIQQLLDKDSTLNKETNKVSDEKKRALELSLKYKFVTPLTSLVVVKPNETKAVEPEKASGSQHGKETLQIQRKFAYPRIAMAYTPSFAHQSSLLDNLMKNSISGLRPLHRPAFGGPQNIHTLSFGAPSYGAGFGGAQAPVSLGLPGQFGPPPPAMPFYPSTPVTTADRNGQIETAESPEADIADDSNMTNLTISTTTVPQGTVVPVESLLWLGNFTVDDPNSEGPIIEIASGNFTVAINQTDASYDPCPLPSAVGGSGHCRHLQYCALINFVDDIKNYEPYFCVISNIFAGVCCPYDP